jgi:PAS domain S-box-containing protein
MESGEELPDKDTETAPTQVDFPELLQSAPFPIYEIEASFTPKIKRVNDAMVKLVGYSKEELLTCNVFELLTAESKEKFEKRIKVAMAGRQVDENVEYDIIIKSGERRTLVLNTKPTFRDGKYVGALVVAYDITERKKAEEELHEMQYRLTIAKDAAKLGIYDYYLSSGSVYWDKRVRDIWGIPEDETVTFEMFLSALHPDDRKVIEWSEFTPESRNFNVDYRVINKQDGKTRWVKATGTFFFIDGKPNRLIGTIEDITDRKELEKQLQDNERMAAIGTTAGMVGHDIRNPLQAMVSDIYLVRSELTAMPGCETNNDIKESLDSLENNITYINKIIGDLQDYTRLLTPHIVQIKVGDKVANALKNVRIPEKIRLHVNIHENLVIQSDADFLRRALTNLINNAVQAMPNGGDLTIEVKSLDGKVAFEVQDTGVGIPDDIKPNLFKPLFTTKSKGQGLGLAVVKRLVEALNGTITVESEEGKGTIFIIELPSS